MRKQFHVWTGTIAVAAAALVLAGVSNVLAQVGTQPVNPKPANQYQQHQNAASMDREMGHKDACKASDVIGLNVRAKTGDDSIGEIKDLMISHDGRVEYVAVSFGGFLGMGDKLFAVPLEAIDFENTGSRDSGDSFARIDVTEQKLRDKKGFDEDNWPAKADTSFATSGSRRQAERPLHVGENIPQ